MTETLEEWLVDRPQIIKDLARSHPPDGEYRLVSDPDGDSYQIYSYFEGGTMKVIRYARLADGCGEADVDRVRNEAGGSGESR